MINARDFLESWYGTAEHGAVHLSSACDEFFVGVGTLNGKALVVYEAQAKDRESIPDVGYLTGVDSNNRTDFWKLVKDNRLTVYETSNIAILGLVRVADEPHVCYDATKFIDVLSKSFNETAREVSKETRTEEQFDRLSSLDYGPTGPAFITDLRSI